MSSILFLTSIYDYHDKGNLYTDLVDTFAAHGNKVTVMTPKERRYHSEEKLENYGNIRCLNFKCLNFRGKVNIIEKGIATLSLGFQYKKAFEKHFKQEKFDVVIYATLPITYAPIVTYVKKRGAVSYLLQKDFFPQSAVDLGIMKKDSLTYRMFRHIEKELFACSDMIGVISPKNVVFFQENNPGIDKGKVEYCPNSMIPMTESQLERIKAKKASVREKTGIPKDATVFLYGGVISRAQGVAYIKKVFTEIARQKIEKVYFVIIGSGNGYGDLERHVAGLELENVMIRPFMPKKEFDEILGASDVGMVFLDHKFTIANIPSRTLAHLDMGQPIVAATDSYTDYRELIEKNQIGLWCESTDPGLMVDNIRRMAEEETFRKVCGENARELMVREYSTEVTYSIIKNSIGHLC